MSTTYPRDTLGYHRQMALAVFGEDSPAVSFLDQKIAESPHGAEEPVVAEESQMVMLLAHLHRAGRDSQDSKVEQGDPHETTED